MLWQSGDPTKICGERILCLFFPDVWASNSDTIFFITKHNFSMYLHLFIPTILNHTPTNMGQCFLGLIVCQWNCEQSVASCFWQTVRYICVGYLSYTLLQKATATSFCCCYRRSQPLSRYFVLTFWPLCLGGRDGVGLMAGAISVSRNPVIRRQNFNVLAAV